MASDSDLHDFSDSRLGSPHLDSVCDSLLARLNLHHLYYFWVVASLGSIRRGSERLLLSPPTVSRQIKELENKLQIRLFARSHQNVELTAEGEHIRLLCNELFGIANQLINGINASSATEQRVCLTVGVAGNIPKLTVFKILRAAVQMGECVKIVCTEVAPDKLASYLSKSLLDIILADFPTSPQQNFGPSCHLIAESPIVACGSAELAKRLRKGFPSSLRKAPVLLPGSGSLRTLLDQYFQEQGITPNILGEFDDSTMIKFFGEAGHGVFFVPANIAVEVTHRYRCEVIGTLENVHSSYYAIVSQRTFKNPITTGILEVAKQTLASDLST
jgi:LysR family transcriptional activator of nhaA